jgi:hypothetical protein
VPDGLRVEAHGRVEGVRREQADAWPLGIALEEYWRIGSSTTGLGRPTTSLSRLVARVPNA